MGEGLEGPDHGAPADQVEDGVAGRLLPEVCAAHAWPEVVASAKDIDLRVAQMAQGAAVLAVPRHGGPLRGFLTDDRGLIIGDVTGTEIRADGAYTSLSATSVDGRLVVGLVEDGAIRVNLVRDDLGAYDELAKLDGTFIGDAAMMPARNQRVTTTGSPAGLVVSAFDGGWAALGSAVLAPSAPTSMTSAAYGNDAMVAWSTDTACHLRRVASNISGVQDTPCRNPRIATDFARGEGQLVYEQGEGVWLSNLRPSGHNEIANTKQLVARGHSPRIAFDGQRYWVSYLDVHGDIVVGFLDDTETGTETLVSLALAGTRPARGAHDLALINGAIEVYALDGETGFGGHRLCLRRN